MIELALAIISLVATITGGFMSMRKEQIKNQILHQELLDRMKVVEQKIDIHNGYAEKFAACDKSIAKIEVKISNIEEKLNALQRKAK